MSSFSSYSITGMILSMLLCGNTAFSQNPTFHHDRKVEMVVEEAPSTKAAEFLQTLKEGNKRFFSGVSTHQHQDPERIKDLSKGQHPKCIIVSCSDSRIPPEIVFDQGLGDIFSIRTAGNVMSDYEEGSIEYAVEHLHTPLIIVMGHQGCGAIQALLDHADDSGNETVDHISKIIEKLKSEEEEQEVLRTVGKDFNRAVMANIMNGVRQLRKSEPHLKKMYHKGEINIVGAVYHIESGEVEFLDF